MHFISALGAVLAGIAVVIIIVRGIRRGLAWRARRSLGPASPAPITASAAPADKPPHHDAVLDLLDLEAEQEREDAFARQVIRHHAAFTVTVREAAAELGYTPRQASALLERWGHHNIAASILLRPERAA